MEGQGLWTTKTRPNETSRRAGHGRGHILSTSLSISVCPCACLSNSLQSLSSRTLSLSLLFVVMSLSLSLCLSPEPCTAYTPGLIEAPLLSLDIRLAQTINPHRQPNTWVRGGALLYKKKWIMRGYDEQKQINLEPPTTLNPKP